MDFERDKTCCFTGHRPEKIAASAKLTKMRLKVGIEKMIAAGKTVFISGMAEGVDLWAAEIVLKLKEKEPELKLICAIPFEGVERKRSEEQRARYRKVLDAADHAEYISREYVKNCFQARDRWMVDHASVVLAVFNGTAGGTKFTIGYAKKQGVQVEIIEDVSERCTLCGKELDCFDLQEKLEFDDIMGYGSSRYDGCHIRFHLCCNCFDRFINVLRKYGKTDPVVKENCGVLGEMTNDQARRLEKVFEFMNQKGIDGIVDKLSKLSGEDIEKEIKKLEEGLL